MNCIKTIALTAALLSSSNAADAPQALQTQDDVEAHLFLTGQMMRTAQIPEGLSAALMGTPVCQITNSTGGDLKDVQVLLSFRDVMMADGEYISMDTKRISLSAGEVKSFVISDLVSRTEYYTNDAVADGVQYRIDAIFYEKVLGDLQIIDMQRTKLDGALPVASLV